MPTLRDRLRQRKSRKDFQATSKSAGPDQMVCGTVADDGRPMYFVVDREAPDDVVEARAFELRHGRPIEPGELMLLQAARKMRAQRAD